MPDLTIEPQNGGYHNPQLTILEECKLQCLGCDKPTAELIVVDKNPKYPRQILQVLCHRCGQLSFRKTFDECKVIYNIILPYRLVDAQMISNEHILIEVR